MAPGVGGGGVRWVGTPPAASPVPVPVRRNAFADAMTRLVTGVAVVTARRPDGRACGLLVSSICSYSADPPSVLVAVGHARGSYPALVACSEFGVHVLGAGHRELAEVFASQDRDKFARVSWRWAGAVPRLAGVPVFFRCYRRAVLQHGDHAIIIGEVAHVETEPGDPLVYYCRRFGWRLSGLPAAPSPPASDRLHCLFEELIHDSRDVQ